MRGVDKDEIIVNILKEGAKTSVELRDEAMKRGLSKSTFYKHIEKLVRSGEVKETKYEIVARIEEANREEVDECLKTLIEDDNEHVIYSRLKQLTKLSYGKRLAQFPNVIQKITGLLDKSVVVDIEQNLNQLFECLTAILFFEQNNKGMCWEEICERLVNSTLEKAGGLLLRRSNSRIIEYLGRTDRKYAVDIIFTIMQQHNIEADKNEFSSISMALGKDRLSKEYKKIIQEKLDNFLRSGDERLIKLASTLRERII